MGEGIRSTKLAKAPNTPQITVPRHYGDAEQAFGDAARAVKDIPTARLLVYASLRSELTSIIDRHAALLRAEFDSDVVEAAVFGAAKDIHLRYIHKE